MENLINILSTTNKSKAGLTDIGSSLLYMGSAFASLKSAEMTERQLNIQNLYTDISIKKEEIALRIQKLKATKISNNLRKTYLKKISSDVASFGARGVDISSGIGKQFTIQSFSDLAKGLKDIESETRYIELDSQSAISSLKLEKSNVEVSKNYARTLGLAKVSIYGVKGLSTGLAGFKSLIDYKKTPVKQTTTKGAE